MTFPLGMSPTGFGPGSPSGEDGDQGLECMAPSHDMRTFALHVPDLNGAADTLQPALDLLEKVAVACARVAATGAPVRFELVDLDAANLALLAETLGEGEVAAKVHRVPSIAVQESVFAGVWRLRSAGQDYLEVAAIPQCVSTKAFTPRRDGQIAATPHMQGIVNAQSLLAELCDKSISFGKDSTLHVVNLSLLPHTEEDLVWLDEALGEGAVTILSRGCGNWRISATVLPHVWRVQFFNSMDAMILDTFEVTLVPEVALAAPEDLADSGARILQVIDAIA